LNDASPSGATLSGAVLVSVVALGSVEGAVLAVLGLGGTLVSVSAVPPQATRLSPRSRIKKILSAFFTNISSPLTKSISASQEFHQVFG
jgi:type III secretory pathway component EscU